MREIGSEFMTDSFRRGKNDYCQLVDYPKRYVLSGRTGLHIIAQELKSIGVDSVSLPAYCCGSMVAPFIDAQVTVSFYEDYCVPKSNAILIMDYFGFMQESTVYFACKCHEAGLKVIVDATQTAFSRTKVYEFSDYLVVSYRKWFDCLCAAVYSKKGFHTSEFTRENKLYVETWRIAAKKKREYLENNSGEKQDYLDLYAKANHLLADDYIGYAASSSEIDRFKNLDSSYLRDCRRSNAKTLLSGLEGKVRLMFMEMSAEDCPLHIPILLDAETRIKLRKALIQTSIYCPCHWPIDKKYPFQVTKYHEEELSLICDQRYSKSDMMAEIEELYKSIL